MGWFWVLVLGVLLIFLLGVVFDMEDWFGLFLVVGCVVVDVLELLVLLVGG